MRATDGEAHRASKAEASISELESALAWIDGFTSKVINDGTAGDDPEDGWSEAELMDGMSILREKARAAISGEDALSEDDEGA